MSIDVAGKVDLAVSGTVTVNHMITFALGGSPAPYMPPPTDPAVLARLTALESQMSAETDAVDVLNTHIATLSTFVDGLKANIVTLGNQLDAALAAAKAAGSDPAVLNALAAADATLDTIDGTAAAVPPAPTPTAGP